MFIIRMTWDISTWFKLGRVTKLSQVEMAFHKSKLNFLLIWLYKTISSGFFSRSDSSNPGPFLLLEWKIRIPMGPNKTKLTCFNTVLECKSFTRIILITVKDEPQCCSIACYSFSKILWGSFTAMSWCLTIIGIVVLSARSRSKSCKKKMNLLRPALRHFVFTWLQQRQAVVSV